MSLSHANLFTNIGPDSVRVIQMAHAPMRPHTKHSLSNFNPILNGLTAWLQCILCRTGVLWISLPIVAIDPFRCSIDQTRVHNDSGKVLCMQLTAYHVVHVPLHLIHTMVILHLRTSCPCAHPFPLCEGYLDYRRDCTSLCSPLLPLSCTWGARAHD